MKITVTDGKTEATIPYPSDLSVEALAERICIGLGTFVANDLIASITVTERPAEEP